MKAVLELNVLRGCQTTVGKPERHENAGGEFEHMVGHPMVA